ncbi:MarR family transcriptional regulator [Rhodococcus sp. IEGM 1366]|uniref:MarR family winged helix-turn-helix transcriptional regulator n=1 Tax=Rhodococcus sp. IEGM 1366 TaxID=3082223 RepID=UPI0029552733|nr:MarR family transcriptional regulator [Rhodococcus sp. IEGM 1366]MDV8071379.1 MarR family transcriptional regulator [Rhodococcus sp. IEGM 1366]
MATTEGKGSTQGSEGAGLAEFERELAAVMRQLMNRDTIGDVSRRSGFDLPPASWGLLEHLDARGSMRVSAIAACHGVDVSSITPRLKTLEQSGLVDRQTLPTDARVSMISITAEGRCALDSVHAARRELLTEALEGVDVSQIATAANVLAQIAHRI